MLLLLPEVTDCENSLPRCLLPFCRCCGRALCRPAQYLQHRKQAERCCRAAVKALLPPTWEPGTRDRLPFELILAVNKMDSLPRVAAYRRVEDALRRRMHQAGLPPPAQVHLVSCVRKIGVRRLLRDLVDLVRLSLSPDADQLLARCRPSTLVAHSSHLCPGTFPHAPRTPRQS